MEISSINPPTVSFRVSNTDVRVDTGELLFPVLVLVFCAAYYVNTRGLPDRSMMYAEPLLYTTAVLAVTTVFGQSVSFKRSKNGRERTEGDGFIGWGESKDESKADSEIRNPSDGFGVSSAVKIAVLLTGYVLSLYVVPFVVGTTVFLGSSLYVFGEHNPVRIAAYSVGFTVLTWAVFVEWLLVPLP